MAASPEDLAHHHIEQTQKQLRDPDVIEGLGHDAARRLLNLADSLYVPEITKDREVAFKPEGTPLIVLDPGDSVTLTGEFSGITDFQRKVMTHQGISPDDQRNIESIIKPTRTITMTEDSGGKTPYRAGLYETPSGKRYVARGAPMIAMSSDLRSEPGYDTVPIHELVHVAQALHQPYHQYASDIQIFDETRAYRVQAKVDAALHGKEPQTRAQKVDHYLSEWEKAGGALVTPEDRIAFEQYLREREAGVLSSRITLSRDT